MRNTLRHASLWIVLLRVQMSLRGSMPALYSRGAGLHMWNLIWSVTIIRILRGYGGYPNRLSFLASQVASEYPRLAPT
jgi:hypothetical protein